MSTRQPDMKLPKVIEAAAELQAAVERILKDETRWWYEGLNREAEAELEGKLMELKQALMNVGVYIG